MLWLMLVCGMGIAWWKDRQSFDARLRKIEQMYSPGTQQKYWAAADILGAPDDPTGTAGKSWCPLSSSATDWVEVSYDKAIAAATIDIYETYSTGCVTEVLVVDAYGTETCIWKGTDPTPATTRTGLFQVPVPKSISSVAGVKIHVDSTGKNPWACVDAVGLTNAAGQTTWTTSSNCSTVYGNGPLMATTKKVTWLGLW
jgi:hypothetical protein